MRLSSRDVTRAYALVTQLADISSGQRDFKSLAERRTAIRKIVIALTQVVIRLRVNAW